MEYHSTPFILFGIYDLGITKNPALARGFWWTCRDLHPEYCVPTAAFIILIFKQNKKPFGGLLVLARS
jgi:hypothetical protein